MDEFDGVMLVLMEIFSNFGCIYVPSDAVIVVII